MGQGMGPVQRAVSEVLLSDGSANGLTVEEITQRVYRKLRKRSGYGGWKNHAGGPTESHYRAVRTALAGLEGRGVSIERKREG